MSRRRVLLVDDDPNVRRLIATTLGPDDFEILEARDGEEALQVAREERPDLVVLDVMMPGPNGFEVCRALKRNPATRAIRVVLLTALRAEEDRFAGQAAEADAYLTKPFGPLLLLDTIHEILG